MKISFAVSVLILAAAAFFIVSRERKINTLKEEWSELKTESETYDVPIDPTIAYSADRARAESKRRQRREKVREFSAQLVAFSLRMKEAQSNGTADELQNSGEVAKIIDSIMKLNPEELRELVSQVTNDSSLDQKQKEELVGFSVMMLAQNNPLAALSIALESREMFEGSSSQRDQMIEMALSVYAAQEPIAAVDWLIENKEKMGKFNENFRRTLLASAASRDFHTAFALIEKLEFEDELDAYNSISRMVTPERAEDFLKALRGSEASGKELETTIGLLASSSMLKEFDKTTAWLEKSTLSTEEKAAFIKTITPWNAKGKESEWLGWIMEQEALLPEQENLRSQATTNFINNWARNDFVAAGEYVAELPRGEARNDAVYAYAATIADHEPAAAADWAADLPDTPKRQVLIQKIHEQLRQKDPSAAADLATKYNLSIE